MGLVARFPRPVVDLPPSVLQRRMRRMAIRPASEIMVCCKLDGANYATLPLVSRLRFNRGCIDNGTDGMTMACAALSRSLDKFYVPQLEQVGPASVTCKGRSLFARVMNESCAGYLLAFEVNPSCILVIHEIDVREPLRIEEDLPEHACLCVCSRDSLAGVPKDARKRHGERSSVAFAQSEERFTMPMNPGEKFKSTSLCLLPAYFDEIEKRFPDDIRGLGEKVMSHGVMTSSIQIDRILNGLTATSMKTASKPPAKRKRYCAFKPLNSTVRPTPLLISNAAIALQEETSQDSGSHNQEDTRTEPRGCGLARIGVAT